MRPPFIAGLSVMLAFCLHALPASASAFSLAQSEQFLGALAPHAQRYPTRFDSAAQQQAYAKRLREILAQMDAESPRFQDDPESLFAYAFAYAMGHNMDIPGCADKAIAGYRRLLALRPDDQRANYYFGSFLAATTLFDQAPPYLLEAIALGEQDAHYTLAFIYIKQGKTSDALAEFKAYLRVAPDDATARKMVGDIEKNDLKIDIHMIPLQTEGAPAH